VHNLTNLLAAAPNNASPFGNMDTQELQTMFLDFSRASKVLNDSDKSVAAKICEVLKQHLRNKCDKLVKAAHKQPLLFSYTSDATSLVLRTQASAEIGGKTVHRSGKELIELLMQRGFFKTVSSLGTEEAVIYFGDPVPLTEGKTSWHLFGAACRFYPLLRSSGHQSICIFHFCGDRAVFASLQKMLLQRSEGFYMPNLGPELGEARALLHLTDWSVGTGCSLHDTSNSLKWSLKSTACEASDLKDIHIVVESLRNSFSILHSHLPVLLMSHVAYDSSPDDPDEIKEFWQALGVEANMLDDFVEINPWFRNGQLHVSRALEADSGKMETLSALLLYLFKFRAFTDSRWVTMGPSLRTVLASLAVGLEALVRISRADPKTTDYHLHGFDRLNAKHKEYFAVVSIVAWIPDSLQYELLTDERVALRASELQQTVSDEINWVHGLSDFTWGRLAELCSSALTPHALKNSTLHAAHVSAAYIDDKAPVAAEHLIDGFGCVCVCLGSC
jgi:hypothetical protein